MPLPTVEHLDPPGLDTGIETIRTLADSSGVRVEHIVSRGEASPDGFWYDAPDSEWVLLLGGHATLRFVDGSIRMSAGDHLLIPAGCRHRVDACSVDATWLAVHFTA